MATKDSDSDTHGWPFGNEKRRVLDVFNTNYGTKLFVENGVLIEEKIQSHSHGDSAAPVGFLPGLCYDKPKYPAKRYVKDQSQTIKSAERALEYYNTRHGTNYMLVDPINSNAFIRSSKIWIHSSFTAKADTSTETSQAGPGKAELFFAEVMIAGHEGGRAKYVTTACRVLDSKAIDHCEICPTGSFSHPKSKFRQGCYKDISRTLRPRSNGKVLKKRAQNCWGN
ncbi:uncharacterized protein LOC141612399 [Silene latifolia]|uniref:uncharacterized protein LOC141612399 n=1 Tax=Silene latifolia TaxID=37657 RepID=UPI003D77C980